MTAEALEALKPHLSQIEGIFLFGSFARNEQTKESDIDVLVVPSKGIAIKKTEKFDFLVKT
ncbi:MAG: nucleotidyltransferase domain-containing protein [Candidatus Diapherotrites archaeon]|nr:nucleotidyltransferase domain-containing protein [Candidatus Diapherotrites archaeon]